MVLIPWLAISATLFATAHYAGKFSNVVQQLTLLSRKVNNDEIIRRQSPQSTIRSVINYRKLCQNAW